MQTIDRDIAFYYIASMPISFHKMHGLGNDFVIIDTRHTPTIIALNAENLPSFSAFVAERNRGIGCDQVILLEGSDIPFMRIFNADGSEVSACGNATRCVGWFLMQETGQNSQQIQTKAGILNTYRVEKNQVRVMMGVPDIAWDKIPLNKKMDTLHIQTSEIDDGVAVSMGNPHLIMFVDDVDAYPLASVGSTLECSSLFPQRANITVAHVQGVSDIALRTWERGVGETLACGTAACATMVAARRRGLVDPVATLHAKGGTMNIEWQGDNEHPVHPLFMSGEACYVFSGSFEYSFDKVS